MVPDLVLQPPAMLLWLATGSRRLSLRWLRSTIVAAFLLLLLGPAVSAVPYASASAMGALPAPLVGSGLHAEPVSGPAAERLLGVPLLDSALLHQDAHDLGIWAATVEGPYGHTVVVFRVLSTTRQSWLTVLELRSQRPLAASPWDLVVARPATVGGQPAQLYQQPGSTTVAWQNGPTLHVSISEDAQQPRLVRSTPGATEPGMLTEAQFLRLASSLHPRGFQVGPFRLDAPW